MIRIREVKVSILEDHESVLLEKIAKKVSLPASSILDYKIVKKSLDARDKNHILWIYEVDVSFLNEKRVLKRHSDLMVTPKEEYTFSVSGQEDLVEPIVIVGSGPAGIFCAYLLAEAGYRPIVLERGEKIEDRVKTVEEFFKTNQLNVYSNIQFGEGGAGTFSDGKLNTLVKDKEFRGKKVFEILVENGAPPEIMYLSKPHIGTDILRKVMVSMREKILSWGGEIHYSSLVSNLVIEKGKITGVIVNEEERIPCSILVLAIGHSARDTFTMLKEKNLMMRPKNFAVGLRMEHPQKMINESQYGAFSKYLPPANYKLTHQSSNGRGVYTFCMCPGGYVVNASSEEVRLAVNGMSNYLRDGENANSAVVVTVSEKDYGEDLFAGMEFQRRLEEKAYQLGHGLIPVQLYGDFVQKRVSEKLGEVVPNTMGDYSFADLNSLFSSDILVSLKEAIPAFGKKIHGFDREDAILLGVESRTSSPIQIVRNEEGLSNILGIYPCGEGAGYAGGITTAAMDGMRVAEWIAKKYRPFPDSKI
ncbi:MAG: NAD(P)-binding protein [Bacilli bacterium]|nr:NAD(P)-binding protein [Bacilli bacterium]